MDDPMIQNNNPLEESKESLSDVKKKLETGVEIKSDNLKEIRVRNLTQARDSLNNSGTGAVGNPEAKKDIPADFFLKQKGFTSSNIEPKGGGL